MMNTWNFSGVTAGFVWLHLHWFFGIFAVIGFICLTVWALKYLAGPSLKSFAMWFLAIGIIGALLTAPLAATGLQWMMGQWKGKAAMHMVQKDMMGQMMQRMMEHDEETEHEDHGPMMDMMKEMMDPSPTGMMR